MKIPRTVQLVGGSRDGDSLLMHKVGGRFPPFYYVAKRMTLEESRELIIDDSTAWKAPEDVYEWREGTYRYIRTINYKP